MFQIVLYFLHSILLLSFYIGVVLTLSINSPDLFDSTKTDNYH